MRRCGRKRFSRCCAKLRNVVEARAQRRQVNFERVDAVHQVFAEIAGFDHFVQVAMRGADDAHIDGERLVFADAANLAAFQHAQQLGLHRLGQLADFVEEHRAAVGDFEQTDAVLVGTGEAPLRWPNSSLSIRVSGSAPQLMATNGLSARGL